MLHFHKWKTVIRERTELSRTYNGKKDTITGLRILEVCAKCGKIRAWLVDSNSNAQEKLPESVFLDEELEKAVIDVNP